MSARYELRVRGRLSSALAGEFERMHLRATTEPVETVLHGSVEDQAALHCLLRRIEAFGLELIDIRRGTPDSGPVEADRGVPA